MTKRWVQRPPGSNWGDFGDDDRLGRLDLSDEGLMQRDRLVLDACLRRRLPVATVIGGGYDTLQPLVRRHAIVVRAAVEQARLYGL